MDRLAHDDGKTFHPDVLFVGGDGKAEFAPRGTQVTAKVLGGTLGEKIRIGKYKKSHGLPAPYRPPGEADADRDHRDRREAACEAGGREAGAAERPKTAAKPAAAKPATSKAAVAKPKPKAEKPKPAAKPKPTAAAKPKTPAKPEAESEGAE